jgi:hypothetical protein
MTGKMCREEIAYATQKEEGIFVLGNLSFAQLVQIVIHRRVWVFDVAAFD